MILINFSIISKFSFFDIGKLPIIFEIPIYLLSVICYRYIAHPYLEQPWLTFLNLRHQDVMARFDTHTVRCEGQEDVEVISSLIQQHQNVKMETGMGKLGIVQRDVFLISSFTLSLN